MAFAIKAEQLTALVDPKSAEALAKLGGTEHLLKALKTDAKNGLPATETKDGFAARRAQYGQNVLPEGEKTTFLGLVWEGLHDKTLIMLMVAAMVSLVLGLHEDPASGWIDGTAILVAVFAVVTVSAFNDYSKESQFRALNAKKENKDVKVIRGGLQLQVSVYDLNVGDIVTVETGDIIPADGVYVSGHSIKCDESGVTGESDAIEKPEGDPFFLSGTQVLDGYGSMVIIAVGPNSIHGKTMMSLRTESEDTPLQSKLDQLADQIGHVGLGAAILTLGTLVTKHIMLDWYNGQPLFSVDFFTAIVKYLITAITMVVVAVPEGLPLAVTMALAYSMMKMLDDNNLVRHLAACETMGGATTICSDKTGTLTQNRMTVVEGKIMGVQFGRDASVLKSSLSHEHMDIFVKLVALNSTAYEGQTSKGTIEFIGNKTESALLGLIKSLGKDYAKVRAGSVVTELLPFSSQRKSMSAVEKIESGHRVYVKGASEIILSFASSYITKDGKVAPLDKSALASLNEHINTMAKNALRTIGLAYRDASSDIGPVKWEEFATKDLILVGIVGIEDPLRDEVPAAVARCQKAGIIVRMVTGDNKVTAMNIAKNCGIYKEGSGQAAMEGPEFRSLSDKEREELVPRLAVLARSSPLDKQILVDTLKRLGEVVAVTGDGTNDAPALKLAHVGFSMGITGTEVAKEASDIVLMDDNFSSIVKAVMWGRNVYDSIRKFLQFQLTVNVVAVSLAFIGSVTDAGGESPLKPVQLLWVNLIMDTLAALALATEPPTVALLDRKPYGRDGSSLISPTMWKHVIGQAGFQLAVNLGILYLAPSWLGIQSHSTRHLTIFFNTFVLCQVFNEINARRINDEINVFSNFFNNNIFLAVVGSTLALQFVMVQFGGSFAGTVALSTDDWMLCIGIAILSLPIGLVLRLSPIEKLFVKPAPQPKKQRTLKNLVQKSMRDGSLAAISGAPKHRRPDELWNKAIRDVVVQRSIIEFLRRNRRRHTGSDGAVLSSHSSLSSEQAAQKNKSL